MTNRVELERFSIIFVHFVHRMLIGSDYSFIENNSHGLSCAQGLARWKSASRQVGCGDKT